MTCLSRKKNLSKNSTRCSISIRSGCFLRDVIKHQKLFTLEQVTRYATPSITKAYLDYLVSLKLVKKTENGYVLARGPIRSFGETLEWYVAEVFKREFGSAAVWGVKFKRPRVGGDYDVIAKIDGALVYVEVKSSPPKQIYEARSRRSSTASRTWRPPSLFSSWTRSCA